MVLNPSSRQKHHPLTRICHVTKPAPKLPATQQQLGKWLKNLRGDRTQIEIAAAAGTTERNLIRWETQGNKSFLSFLRYLHVLGVKIDPAPPVPLTPLSEETAKALAQIEQVLGEILARLDATASPTGSERP